MGKRFEPRDVLAASAVCLAVVLVALGAGSRGGADGQFRYTHRDAIILAIALGALGLLVAAAVLVAHRLGAMRPRQWLAVVAILGLLAFFAWRLSPRRISLPRPESSSAPPPAPPSYPQGAHSSTSTRLSSLPIVPIVIATLIVVMLVVAIVVGLRRRPSGELSPDDEGAVEVAVYAAIDAGDEAMRDIGDPRQAIIACYAAMERVLAAAGLRRLAAETPNDLLSRAAQFRHAHHAARRLTALFLEARFSSHPMSGADREEARAALAELRKPANLVADGVR